MRRCPCGPDLAYSDCCGRFISGDSQPITAEQLMRSRYSAFCLAEGDYLFRTQHPDFRGQDRPERIAERARKVVWQRLDVISAQGGSDDEHGEVEFKAWYQQGDALAALHERSRFVRIDGQWFYTDGDLNRAGSKQISGKGKVGRNDACPCGSGKKYKRCCGK